MSSYNQMDDRHWGEKNKRTVVLAVCYEDKRQSWVSDSWLHHVVNIKHTVGRHGCRWLTRIHTSILQLAWTLLILAVAANSFLFDCPCKAMVVTCSGHSWNSQVRWSFQGIRRNQSQVSDFSQKQRQITEKRLLALRLKGSWVTANC